MSHLLKVLLFAGVREALGCDTVSIRLDSGACVADLLTLLAGEHPEIAARRRSLGVAVNQALAPSDQVLKVGDEVALIPPLGGG
ncbi:MAG: molybdopterin converting factor subunit 1 [Planctomycetes bacterium]|nr:molybdopterin converting factor subunit 1 [Planctomycetota bacterium]